MAIRISPDIASIVPYSPGKPIEEVEREFGITGSIKLASNENPRGPSPKALAVLTEVAKTVNRYPDGGGYYLRDALAEEMPEAYKDVREVVDVVHGFGISTKVARLRPLGVVKG